MFKRFLLFTLVSSVVLVSCTTQNNDLSIMEKNVSIEGFTKDEDTFICKINHECETFSFINRVSVPKNTTWAIYSDVSGTNEILTKTIECNIGDNVVYLLVSNEKESIGFYKVNVYRFDMFTVTFNTDGGTYIEPQRVQEESLIQHIKDPEKEGYSFVNWDYDFSQPVVQDLIINANWNINKYIITFNTDGGLLDITTLEVTFNSYVSLPTPTKTGCTFLGWFYNGRRFSSGIWQYAGNVSLLANWEMSKYIITYFPNGGIVDGEETQNVIYGQQFTLRNATRKGYDFMGWFDGEAIFTSGVWNIESNKDLIAHWNARTYTITFDVNGGDPLTNNSANVVFDQVIALPTPKRVGYDFSGWYIDGLLFSENDVWSYDSNKTLVAGWTPKRYKITLSKPTSIAPYIITYIIDKQTNEIQTQDIYPGQSIQLIKPVHENKSLIAWCLDEQLTTIFDPAKQEINDDIVLYAKWGNTTSLILNNMVSYDKFKTQFTGVMGGVQSSYYYDYVHYYATSSGTYSFKFTGSAAYFTKYCFIFSINSEEISEDEPYHQKDSSITKSYSFELAAGDDLQIAYLATGSSAGTHYCRFSYSVQGDDELIAMSRDQFINKAIEVEYDSTFDLGLPHNIEGTFIGWFTESDGKGTKLTDSSGKSIGAYGIASDTVAYPYFQ